jgi:glycosyltransferase involved in cell wall biosynthesis
LSTPDRPFLFVTTILPGTGFGAGERSASLLQALRAIGPTRVLLLRHPWHAPVKPGDCDHVIDAIAPGASERAYYWRRQVAAGPFRTEPRLVDELSRIIEREPVRAILCRYALTLGLDAPRFAPSMIDIDDVPTDRRSLLLVRSMRGYRTVFVAKGEDVAKIPHPDVRVLPCISTSAHAVEERDADMNLLFIGASGHPPNAEGAKRFVTAVWPRIRAQLPDATLTIAGSGWSAYDAEPGVRVPGFIESLEAAYRRAAVVVCPIWSGAGACVKLAEAAGFARPIVTTPFAAAGYAGILDPGEHLLVADSDEAFAAHCLKLLRDAPLRERLAAAAGSRAAQRLSTGALEQILRDALDAHGA